MRKPLYVFIGMVALLHLAVATWTGGDGRAQAGAATASASPAAPIVVVPPREPTARVVGGTTREVAATRAVLRRLGGLHAVREVRFGEGPYGTRGRAARIVSLRTTIGDVAKARSAAVEGHWEALVAGNLIAESLSGVRRPVVAVEVRSATGHVTTGGRVQRLASGRRGGLALAAAVVERGRRAGLDIVDVRVSRGAPPVLRVTVRLREDQLLDPSAHRWNTTLRVSAGAGVDWLAVETPDGVVVAAGGRYGSAGMGSSGDTETAPVPAAMPSPGRGPTSLVVELTRATSGAVRRRSVSFDCPDPGAAMSSRCRRLLRDRWNLLPPQPTDQAVAGGGAPVDRVDIRGALLGHPVATGYDLWSGPGTVRRWQRFLGASS